MKLIFLQLLIFILGINITFSQSERKRANYWHFGSKAALDFSCLPPQSFAGSQLSSGEGSASMSDINGNLLMYTNSQTVWDANNNVMPNGTGLLGSVSTVQGAVIIPKPGNPNIYYIFTAGTSIESHGQVGVHYSEVDMTLNGGMGDVTANKNIFLFNPNEEKLTAVANGAGNGYWVVAQKYNTNEWYAYEVTAAGVNTTPVISATGPIARFENSLDAKLSPDGTMMASQNQCNANYDPSICLYSFNSTTGVLNFLWEDCGGAGPSLEFSPDCTKLYAATNQGIKQYNLTAGANISDAAAIIASKTTVMTPASGSGSMVSMQLANDCKIYISQGGLSSGATSLNVIDKPNLAGVACSYIPTNTPIISGNCLTRLTNFVTSFFYNGCPELDFELNVTDAECQADGAIDLVITNGTPPFYYDWSNGATTQDLTGLNGGWYSVKVTDDFGNCKRDSVYVAQNQQTVAITETLTHPSACGATDGAINLVITSVGGANMNILTENFETNGEGSRYVTVGLQDPGTSNKFFKRAAAGSFSFFGGSLSGQQGTSCFGLRNPTASPVSLTMNPATITGYYNLNLCVLLAAIGNVNASDYYNIDYQIDGGAWVTLARFRPTSFPYKIAEDTDGDNVGDGVQLNNVFQDFCYPISASGNQIAIRIVSNASGSTSGFAFDYIRLTGIPPLTYTIAWSPDGETTPDITNKAAGTYTVTITTSTGCVVTESYVLNDPCTTCVPPALIITNLQGCSPNSLDLNNAIDPSSDPATKTFYSTQSNANSATSPISSSVTTSGSYWVRAVDPNDPTCFGVYEIQVTLTTVTYTTNNTNPTCGNTNGAIVITPGTGFTITDYSIDNGATTQTGGTFSNLGAGTYTIVITDANGCEGTGTVTLSNAGSTDDASFTVANFCAGTTNSATITGTTGGTFTIVSPTGDGATINGTTGEITNGVGGTTYTIKYDTGGACAASETHTVTVNPSPTYTTNNTNPTCGNSDGTIVITPAAGFTIATYSIDNGATTQTGGTFSNLGAGSYTIVITDANGCEGTGTVTLSNAGSTDDASFTLADFCVGTANSATITGTAGGTFTIVSPTGDGATINGATGQITNGVGGTTYTIQYTTSSTCPASETHTVKVNPKPTYSTYSTGPICDISEGSIIITPAAGFTITSYSIDNGTTTQTGGTFSNLAAGSYAIVVIDANGCKATGTVILTTLSGPTIDNVSSTDASCNANDGTITVTTSGGSGTLSYSLNTGQTSTNGTFTGLASGNYTVTVTDVNGCVSNQSITVAKAGGPTITLVNNNPVSCFGKNDGSAEVSATGGAIPFTYTWSPTGGSAATATGLAPGTYTVEAKDNVGCVSQLQIIITEPAVITINETIIDANCGQNNGEIALTVAGGTGSYTYNWNPNVSTTDQATGLAIGTYEVTVSDGNGCSLTASYDVVQGNSFFIDATPGNVTILQGESVEIHLFIDTTVIVDTIIWIPSEGLSCSDCKDPIASPTNTTTYIVTVIDENGCTSTDTVVVNVILPCPEIFVPNMFSPNSDGLNDLQCVLGGCVASLDFTIFDRWGEVVFRTQDQKECWDGTFRGKLVQSDVYVYKLKATLDNGEKIEQTGNITVVR